MTDTSALDKPESQSAAIWRQFRQHKGAVFGLCVLAFLIVFTLIGPLFWQALRGQLVARLRVAVTDMLDRAGHKRIAINPARAPAIPSICRHRWAALGASGSISHCRRNG